VAVRRERPVRVALGDVVPHRPCARVAQQRLVGRDKRRYRGDGGRLARLPVTPRQQVPAQLAERRARQWLARHGELDHALVARQALRLLGHRRAHGRVGGITLTGRGLGHQQRHQLAVHLQHGRLGDKRVRLVDRLHLLRLDVLAALGDDQRRCPPQHLKTAVGVEPPKVAGAKPAVRRERLRVRLRQGEITAEHPRPAHLDSARPGGHVLVARLGRRKPQLGARHGSPGAARPALPRQAQREQRRGLGEPVADRDAPAERHERCVEIGLQRRPTAGQQA
jgi:hypothetical protein